VRANAAGQTPGHLLHSHTCPVAEERLLLLWKRLLLSTFHMVVHMTVEPFRIIECTLQKENKLIPK